MTRSASPAAPISASAEQKYLLIFVICHTFVKTKLHRTDLLWIAVQQLLYHNPQHSIAETRQIESCTTFWHVKIQLVVAYNIVVQQSVLVEFSFLQVVLFAPLGVSVGRNCLDVFRRFWCFRDCYFIIFHTQSPVPACGMTFHQDYDGRDCHLTLSNNLRKLTCLSTEAHSDSIEFIMRYTRKLWCMYVCMYVCCGFVRYVAANHSWVSLSRVKWLGLIPVCVCGRYERFNLLKPLGDICIHSNVVSILDGHVQVQQITHRSII